MPDLQFGAFIPQGWRSELTASGSAVDQWQVAVDTAVAAEDLGYDSLWVYDHFHNVPAPIHETVFETWTTLAAISQRTDRIMLGQMVGCAPYRNPGLLAKITSQLDVISNGRLIWGIGAGWYEHEFTGYGYDFRETPGTRLRLMRETIEIVTSMWSQPETSYDGEFFHLDGAQCDPKPLQQPRPQVLVGGGGEKVTLRIVAELADASNFGGNPDEFAHKCDVLRGHCEAVGRDFDDVVKTWAPNVVVADTEAEQRRIAEASPTVTEEFASFKAGNLVGTVDEVVDKIGRYADMGCSGFYPWCADYPAHDTLERFALEVVPQFR